MSLACFINSSCQNTIGNLASKTKMLSFYKLQLYLKGDILYPDSSHITFE